jgi:branched-subunit amino acid aminotransferase/4-amino-4-deoxychorismate lyase
VTTAAIHPGPLPDRPYINGAVATPEQLRALALVNYGHFTSMRVDGGQVRGLSHHLDRLTRDCRRLFDAPLDRQQVREWVRGVVSASDAESFVVRVTVFDPALELGRPSASGEPSVLVSLRPAGPAHPAPLRVTSTTYRRDLPEVKHLGVMGSLWCRRTAQLDGFDDALFVDEEGFISEGVTWNIGFFDGEHVIWPDAPVLPGVTMRLVTQAHERTATRPVQLQDVAQMQAAFATSTTIGVRPIAAIDGVRLPTEHEIFAVLRTEYEGILPETI